MIRDILLFLLGVLIFAAIIILLTNNQMLVDECSRRVCSPEMKSVLMQTQGGTACLCVDKRYVK